ncbi:MAG: hypothetical protein PF690_10530 [Deltaproteobacteria bacterium]|jgi:hypothetical protein|nr:hypothetical protein [Deltaproteobacteria bacterium]
MLYDPEKYREKREKVLGIRKRGLSFSTVASIIAGLIIFGIGFVTVPTAVSYITTRNLDDVIYKLDKDMIWKNAVVIKIEAVKGVAFLKKDKHDTRLVITFDRREADLSDFTAVFSENNLKATLLNRVNHRQRQTTLKEEEELEAT